MSTIALEDIIDVMAIVGQYTINHKDCVNTFFMNKDIYTSTKHKREELKKLPHKRLHIRYTKEKVIRLWYPDGQLKKKYWLSDNEDALGFELEGPYTEWYPNGQLKYQGNFISNMRDRMHIKWYEDGTIKEKGEFGDLEFISNIIEYHPNGKIKSKKKFCCDDPCGIHYEWDSDGNLISQKDY